MGLSKRFMAITAVEPPAAPKRTGSGTEPQTVLASAGLRNGLARRSRPDGAMPCRRSGDPAETVKAGRLVGRPAELNEAIRQPSGSGAANIGADILE